MNVINCVLALAIGFAGSIAGSATAQSLGEGDITIIVPFAPGGGTDTIARIVADGLRRVVKNTITVDNRPGGAGAIGAKSVIRSQPDGHTIMVGTTTLTVDPAYRGKSIGYDVRTDLSPIVRVGGSTFGVMVSPDSPAKTLQDLVKLSHEKVGAVSYASSGLGTVNHMIVELLRVKLGLKSTLVPYPGGAPAAMAVMKGEATFILDSLGSQMGALKGGKLRLLAVTSPERSHLFPDVPTIAESGIPGYGFKSFTGYFAPIKTPETVLDELHDAFAKALSDPATKKALDEYGLEPGGEPRQEFKSRVMADVATWEAIIKEAGIKVE